MEEKITEGGVGWGVVGWGGVGEHLKTSATKPLGTTDKQYMLPQICSGTQRYI